MDNLNSPLVANSRTPQEKSTDFSVPRKLPKQFSLGVRSFTATHTKGRVQGMENSRKPRPSGRWMKRIFHKQKYPSRASSAGRSEALLRSRFLKVFAAAEKKYGAVEKRLAAEEWAEPWQTLIATIMSAQSRDETTLPIAEKLFAFVVLVVVF